MQRLAIVLLGPITLLCLRAWAEPEGPSMTADRTIREVDVATLPHPGTVVPGAIDFAPDGRSVTYLKSEDGSLSRVLWRASVGEKPNPKVIARPPSGGDSDASLSRDEQLRRERMRLRETGITQVVASEDKVRMVVPLGGDLYLIEGGRPLRRLTTSSAPEIDPKLSPDGTRVAFVREGELRVLDIDGGQERCLSKGAGEGIANGSAEFMAQEELGRFSGFWWSPDGSKIAYQQTDDRHVPLYTITHQDGAEYSAETHRYPFAGAANAKVRLGVVPSAGGATTWLKLGEQSEDFYLARVDWDGPESVLVQILSRDQKRLALQRVDLATGEKAILIEERSDTFVNLHDDLRIVPKTGEILWSSERTGHRHLEVHDRAGKFVRALTSGEWPVDGVVRLVAKSREVWFSSGRDNPLGGQLYRVSLDGGAIERATPEDGTHRCVVAPDGLHFADTFSDIATPPATTIRDRAGKILATLDDASKDDRIAALNLSPPRITQFKTRDGTTLHGAYYRPRGALPGQRRPLVVMVYGGPHVQTVTDSWAMTADLTAQFLASRGFAVWKMDNRGSARRGHAFEAAIYRNMGELEVRDQVEGVRFLAASQPEVDPSRVGITGGSYGGYMTLRCLMLAPDVFRAGVAVAPVTDWDGYDTAYTERYMGTPKDNPDGYLASSVIARARDLSGKALIIHGMLDENVHFRHSARLASALIGASRPFELLPIPGERHSSRKVPERTFVAGRIAGFFAGALAD